MSFDPTHYDGTHWVKASRDARLTGRANDVGDAVQLGTMSVDEGKRKFAEILEEAEILKARTKDMHKPDFLSWRQHWWNVFASLYSLENSVLFHANGGMEGSLTEEWRSERRAMLTAMRAAVPTGQCRISKTSGNPVFSDACPASRITCEGVALSWERDIAVRQMEAAGIGWGPEA